MSHKKTKSEGRTHWLSVGFLTKLSGEIQIPSAEAGVPEAADIRAIFIENNAEVGQFSDGKALTR